jgi:hypothetical protein
MIEFDKKQISDLAGQYTIIARSCKVTPAYVIMVLRGKRRQNSAKAQEIAGKAKAILDILSN